jgi:hypothetical protein
MANGTQAKNLVLYYYTLANKSITKKEIAKDIILIKRLLTNYEYDCIKDAIEYYTITSPPEHGMYSLGYLHSVINEFHTTWVKNKLKEQELSTLPKGDIIANNKGKYEKFNNQSWFGKKYNFDLFEEPRKNN